MQASNPKDAYSKSGLNTKPGTDLSKSYMTSTSFYDSDMMDVSAYHPVPIPKPPNDKMIHPSQCKNSKCPLQAVWKKNQFSINNPNKYNRESTAGESKEFDQQFIPVYACSKCVTDVAKYCC
jgi:hypothetical protein